MSSPSSHLRHPDGAPHRYHYRLHRLTNARPASMCESPALSAAPHELAPVKILHSLSPKRNSSTSISSPSAWSRHHPSPSMQSRMGTIPEARSRTETLVHRPHHSLRLGRSTVVRCDSDESPSSSRTTLDSRKTPATAESSPQQDFPTSSTSPSSHSTLSTNSTMRCRERPAPSTRHPSSYPSSHARHESSPATFLVSSPLPTTSTAAPVFLPRPQDRKPTSHDRSPSRALGTFPRSATPDVLAALNPVLGHPRKRHQESMPDQSIEQKRRNSDATAPSPAVFGQEKYLLPELARLSPITLSDLDELQKDPGPSTSEPSTPSMSLDSQSISDDSDLFDDAAPRGSPMIPHFVSSRPTSFLSDRTLLTRKPKRESVIVTLAPAEESSADLVEKGGSASSWSHRRYSQWSGEWNQPDIQDVIQKLRSLK